MGGNSQSTPQSSRSQDAPAPVPAPAPAPAPASAPAPVLNLPDIANILSKGYEQAQKSRNKTVVVLLSATGAGKSTFLNWLYGCQMEQVSVEQLKQRLPQEQAARVVGFHRYIVVKPGTSPPAVAEISYVHGASTTLIPELVAVDGNAKEDLFFWDLPGLKDSRGKETRIANAANIRRVMSMASRVKVILLFDYYSYMSNRGATLTKILNAISEFFRRSRPLAEHMKSVLLVMTKLPLLEKDEKPIQVEEFIKECISFAPEYTELWNKLLLFDPLPNRHVIAQPVMSRMGMLQKIQQLQCITEPAAVFCTALTKGERKCLVNNLDALVRTICSELREGELYLVAQNLRTLKYLQSMDDRQVGDVINLIVNAVKQLISAVQLTRQQKEPLEHLRNLFRNDAHIFNEVELANIQRGLDSVRELLREADNRTGISRSLWNRFTNWLKGIFTD